VTIAEILKFGEEYLGVDYIFWSNEEPYYSERLVPFLKRVRPRMNAEKR